MCKFNVMCQAKDGACNCCESTPFSPQVVRPVLPSAPSDTTLLYHLYALVTQQNEVIRTLSEQTATALKKVETLTKGLEASTLSESSSIVVPREEVTTSEHILSILCGTKTNHPYSLRLLSEIPQPAYKERAFSLMIEIVDRNNNKVNMPIPVNLKIMLFTTESPPKLMKVNTSGDKIMRGTVEVETNGVALFRKIVIKEVTSHFRNGCFFLAVVPKNCCDIKPLVIENFIIKARKILSTEPVKKIKTDDNPEPSLDPSPTV
ncbi:hypothetical protein SteCoe_18349 [Stentor coeruleus]|uniref:Uncharacterized protein n=1 Tax=Stentor coeruleus TaxID=5963 RepID=A0A1R2BWN4_9CILI|nr:hypothetical protein SteCoe_18349 [Stentor coeruleus]